MKHAAVLFLIAGAAALGSRVWAQPADADAVKETRSKAFSTAQTLGPPPTYSLRDVTVLLVRDDVAGAHRKVTYSGTGQTVYVQVKSGKKFGEKADTCAPDDILAILEEVYKENFFAMADDYTKIPSVEEDPPGEITTYTTELHGDYPKVTLTVRIGAFEKTVTAVDGGDYAERFGTPAGLLAAADFIMNRPAVVAITKEVEQ